MENNNDFLPTGYEIPKGNANYMKFEKGENKFRILSKPIIGWLDWDEKKPLRFRMDEKPERSIDPEKKVKHFWAFIVWNYGMNSIQILEVTQSTIQSSIKSLTQDEDWGAPYNYDLKVIKTGDNMETEYKVNPSPKKKLPNEVSDAFEAKPIYLDALYEGADPFAVGTERTPLEDLPF